MSRKQSSFYETIFGLWKVTNIDWICNSQIKYTNLRIFSAVHWIISVSGTISLNCSHMLVTGSLATTFTFLPFKTFNMTRVNFPVPQPSSKIVQGRSVLVFVTRVRSSPLKPSLLNKNSTAFTGYSCLTFSYLEAEAKASRTTSETSSSFL